MWKNIWCHRKLVTLHLPGFPTDWAAPYFLNFIANLEEKISALLKIVWKSRFESHVNIGRDFGIKFSKYRRLSPGSGKKKHKSPSKYLILILYCVSVRIHGIWGYYKPIWCANKARMFWSISQYFTTEIWPRCVWYVLNMF